MMMAGQNMRFWETKSTSLWLIIEHGPTTKEHRDFMARMQHIKAAKAQKELDERMREYEEYNRIMYPNDYYINWDIPLKYYWPFVKKDDRAMREYHGV